MPDHTGGIVVVQAYSYTPDVVDRLLRGETDSAVVEFEDTWMLYRRIKIVENGPYVSVRYDDRPPKLHRAIRMCPMLLVCRFAKCLLAQPINIGHTHIFCNNFSPLLPQMVYLLHPDDMDLWYKHLNKTPQTEGEIIELVDI